jgi:hypothetical protein
MALCFVNTPHQFALLRYASAAACPSAVMLFHLLLLTSMDAVRVSGGLGQAAPVHDVHEGYACRPVAMTVQQRTEDASIQDF